MNILFQKTIFPLKYIKFYIGANKLFFNKTLSIVLFLTCILIH